MTDLTEILGLPASFDENAGIIQYPDSILFEPWFKTLLSGGLWKSLRIAQEYKREDELEFLKKFAENPDAVFYFGQRGVCRKELVETLREHGIRADVTLIPAGTIGDEFIRTQGHAHIGYPEIYQVISGKCVFLSFQRGKDGLILEPTATIAHPGQIKIFSTKDYHISINVGNRTLVLADLVSPKTVPITDFSYIAEHHGAPYWCVQGKEKEVAYRRNHYYYSDDLGIRLAEAQIGIPELSLGKEKPIFSMIPDKLNQLSSFLNPER